MPDTDGAEHLIEYLFEIDPGNANGFGFVNISWTDILSWSTLAGIALTRWESVTLHRMSKAYCGQFAASSKKGALPPWQPPITIESLEAKRPAIANGILSAFRAFSANRKKATKRREHATERKPRRKKDDNPDKEV